MVESSIPGVLTSSPGCTCVCTSPRPTRLPGSRLFKLFLEVLRLQYIKCSAWCPASDLPTPPSSRSREVFMEASKFEGGPRRNRQWPIPWHFEQLFGLRPREPRLVYLPGAGSAEGEATRRRATTLACSPPPCLNDTGGAKRGTRRPTEIPEKNTFRNSIHNRFYACFKTFLSGGEWFLCTVVCYVWQPRSNGMGLKCVVIVMNSDAIVSQHCAHDKAEHGKEAGLVL